MKYPSKKAFKQVCADLESGKELTLEMVGDVFGQPFWIAIVYTMLEAQDAARAIQGAINRLSAGEQVNEEATH